MHVDEVGDEVLEYHANFCSLPELIDDVPNYR